MCSPLGKKKAGFLSIEKQKEGGCAPGTVIEECPKIQGSEEAGY